MSEGLWGAIGGLVSQAITYPLYALTVRIQASRGEGKKANGFRQQARIMYYEDGVGSFYAGFESCLYATVVQSAVYYQFFAWFNRLHGITREKAPHPLWGLTVGAEAGVMTVLLTNPFWVVNSRQVTARVSEGGRVESWWQTVRRIQREEGLRGLHSGLVPALLLVLNPAFLFFFYALLTRLLQSSRRGGGKRLIDYFVLGLLSKLFATLVVFPFFTVKIQLQKSSSVSLQKAESFLDVVHKMYKRDGVSGFWTGISSKLLQTSLTSAILFVTREGLQDASS
jgi:adenine nucleotide transporter 17